MYENYYPKIPKKSISVNLKENATTLTDKLLDIFLESPKRMSNEFYKLWHETYEKKSIYSAFVEPCENLNILKDFDLLRKRVLLFPKMSKDWEYSYKQLYKTEKTEKNKNRKTKVLKKIFPDTETHKEILTRNYSDIRSIVGKQLIHQTIISNLSEITPCKGIGTVGMITEGGIGSRGYCPDSILRTFDNKLVPLVYTTFYSETENCNDNKFLHEYISAKDKLRDYVNVINIGQEIPISNSGIMVFLFISPNKNYNLSEENPFKYEVKWIEIKFNDNELYFS